MAIKQNAHLYIGYLPIKHGDFPVCFFLNVYPEATCQDLIRRICELIRSSRIGQMNLAGWWFFARLKNMKVNEKDYPIYYGKV